MLDDDILSQKEELIRNKDSLVTALTDKKF